MKIQDKYIKLYKLFNQHSFGMLINERSFSSAAYKYGFNGKEKDDEINGAGNTIDFGARIYDSRLGRWFAIDPFYKVSPSYTTYQFAALNPISNIDKDGCIIEPYDETSKITLSNHFLRVFNAKTAELFIAHLSKVDGAYVNITPKEFRKAIKGMSPEQKALARGYYKEINDKKKIIFYVGDKSDKIPNGLLVEKGSEQFKDKTLGEVMSGGDNPAGGGITFKNDKNPQSEVAGVVIVQGDYDYSNSKTDVLDSKGRSAIYTYPVGIYGKGSYNVPEQDGYTFDEVILHENVGHGLFECLLNYTRENGNLISLQVSNLYRKFKEQTLRSGRTDHNQGEGFETSAGSGDFKNDKVKETPNELKKDPDK